ncbi:MAG: hypothetical protein HY273_04480 [Gammaproteobacteria bacterium]|nr:hypothetical protein [Gammaproteobacteria bacterium]
MHDPFCNVRRYQHKYALRLVLLFFMLFALWHVSQHGGQDVVSSDAGHDCQVCRLGHAPAAGGAALVLFAAIFLPVAPFVSVDVPYLRSKSYLPRLARGPPSF